MSKEKFDLENFHEAGFAVIENFYNYETEVLPIIKGISDIIEQVAKHKKINLIEKGEIANLKVNIMSLIAEDRLLGEVIYDAVKQIQNSCFSRKHQNKKFWRKSILVFNWVSLLQDMGSEWTCQ